MKIRADFVTNSSSSSYVDVYADNPTLNQLMKENHIHYERYVSDYCNEHETLRYPRSLAHYLNLLSIGADNLESSFRYAKYNTGYFYHDGYLSGEEHHVTLSSRWGVIDQHTWIDEKKVNNTDELEYEDLVPNMPKNHNDYWERIETDKLQKPSEMTAGFEGARPEDLEKRTDLSDALRMVLDNLCKEAVELKDRKFAFIGDYDQYRSQSQFDEECDDYGEDEEDYDEDYQGEPWDDEDFHAVRGNIPEIGMISLWLSPLGGKIKSIGLRGEIGSADYVVVRLDSWAEDCILEDVIAEAIHKEIPIISEYQFWKAIFEK